MMGSNDWQNRFYLVARPQGGVLEEAKRIERQIDERLDAYLISPPPVHLTLCMTHALDDKDAARASDVIRKVLQDFPPIGVEAERVDCFTEPSESLVITIKENDQLARLQHRLKEALEHHGYLAPSDVEEWIFHVTILSRRFVDSEFSSEDFQKLCEGITLRDVPVSGMISELEFWRPVFDQKERVVERFAL